MNSKSSPSPPTSSMIASNLISCFFLYHLYIQSHCSYWWSSDMPSFVLCYSLYTCYSLFPEHCPRSSYGWLLCMFSATLEYWLLGKGNSEEGLRRSGQGRRRNQSLGSWVSINEEIKSTLFCQAVFQEGKRQVLWSPFHKYENEYSEGFRELAKPLQKARSRGKT